MVAVHGRLEDPHHPGQGLDRLLDAGAEAPGLGEQDSVDSGHKVQVIGSNLVAMSAPTVTSVTAASPAARAGLAVGDELLSLDGHEPRDVIDFQRLSDARGPQRPRPARRRAPAAAGAGRQGGRGAARGRGLLGRLRPGPDLRQPLRVLLHLPAAQGHAAQPVPEGRRLPAVVPVRELHDAHPLHRARRRADPDRAARPAVRLHPHAPTPSCGRSMLRNPKGRDQPALAAGAARRRDRGARPGRRLPGRQRRRGARGHAGRDPRPVPGAGQRRRRAARAEPLLATSPTCARTRGTRPARVVDTIEEWQRVYQRALGRRMVFAADEYYLLAGRDVPAGPPLRRLPPARERHRHGAGLRRVVRPARGGRPRRRAPRVLRLGRRAPRPRATGRRACRRRRPGADEPARHRAHRHLRRPRARAAGGGAPARTTSRCGPWPTTSSAATSAWPACSPGRTSARALAGVPDGPPLPAARRVPQRGPLPRRADPGRPARGRSRWCPPTARSLRLALDGTSFRPACAA